MNPVAVTIFIGMILTIVVYSVMDLTGIMGQLGRFGPVLPLIAIVWLMYGVYRGVKYLKRRAARIHIKGPLYMRSLMNGCLERTCGTVEKHINTPHLASATIFNAILLDKMLYISSTDGLRFTEIRRKIENSRLKGTEGLALACFFQTGTEYHKRPLPDEIRHVSEMVSRNRSDLREPLERLKDTHRNLCTGAGDILSLLPPDEKRMEKLRATHRYRPPSHQRARRMIFALETLAYLRAIRYENVNPLDRHRYESVADQVIPKLAEALKAYRQAWQNLVDAYELPESERP